jgi:2-haloacid dehalogenase
MTVRTIIFDFGNVVIGWDPRRVYRPLLGHDEAAIDQFFDEVAFSAWNLEQDRGRKWVEAVSELSARFPHRHDLIRAYDEQWEKSITGPIEGTVRILYRLHGAGYKLVGLTNWSAEKFHPTRLKHEFFEVFDDIVVSGDVGLVKPDPAIFELTLQRVGRRAEECLFIDDSATNVDAAAAIGFHTIRFESPEQLERELRAHGIQLERTETGLL